MPITASAKKALRQSITRKARNLKRSNTYKNSVKQIEKAMKSRLAEASGVARAGDNTAALKLLPNAYKAIDKASKSGVIKKNKASRLKSYIAKLLSK